MECARTPHHLLKATVRPASVLLFGEVGTNSGYSRVLAGLARSLSHVFNVSIVSLFPVEISSEASDGVGALHEEYGAGGLRKILERESPQVLIVVHDIGASVHLQALVETWSTRIWTVLYSALDYPTLDPGVVSAASHFRQIAVFTARQASLLRSSLDQTSRRFRCGKPKIGHLPPGIDKEFFTNESVPGTPRDRLALKQQLFPDGWGKGRLLFLAVGRNIVRKRMDIVLEAFALVAHLDGPRIGLVLHTASNAHRGWDIPNRIRQLGIAGSCRLTAQSSAAWPASSLSLAKMYRACEVGITTSVAEGWSLPTFEHAASGGVLVVPRTEHFLDIWQDGALYSDTSRPQVGLTPFAEEQIVDVDSLARMLQRVRTSRRLRAEQSRRAISIANRNAYRWEAVSQRWTTQLAEAVGAQG